MRPLNKTNSRHHHLDTGIIQLSLLVIITIFLIISGCSNHHHSTSAERKLIKRSSQNPPQWISQLPSNKNYFYALGISTDASSIQQGRQFAAKNAIVEVSNYLGLKASGSFEIQRTALTTRILEDISTTTSANLKRSRLTQMYYEQFRYHDNDESAQVFDVYILLRIPMSDLQREQKKQIQIKNKILLEVQAINHEAQNHLSAGNFPLAWHKWVLALRLLDEETSDKVATLKIYKALLTAVEGISLSVNSLPNSSTTQLKIRAVYSSKNSETPLKDLPLHLRFTNINQAEQVRKTNSSGQLQQSLSSATGKNLQIRLMMSPYAIDMQNLSAETTQKITFLNSMLEKKLAQYGDSPTQHTTTNNLREQSSTIQNLKTGTADTKIKPLINIDINVDNPYVLLNNQQYYPVTLKVDIKATQKNSMKRLPLNLVVVLDKSGSMNSDQKLYQAKKATRFLIDHLTTQDYLAIIAYSSDVETIIPSELVSSKTLIKHHLSEIEAGGMTNLSGGLFEGYAEVKKHFDKNSTNRILLLSDGIANHGITDTNKLIPYIKQYNLENISVSALGVGQDYNDELMIKIAENSRGNYYYIKNSEDIPGIFSQELTQLINLAIQNTRVTVQLAEGVKIINTFGHTYTLSSKNKLEFRLGDLNFDERGMLLLELSVPTDTQKSKAVAIIAVDYTNVSTQKNISYAKPLSVSFTRNTKLYKQSFNTDVEKYIILTRSIEKLEKVLESLDHGLFEQAIRNIRKTYASIEAYARGSEDADFLQRLKLLKHFEAEAIRLKETGELHNHDQESKKNLGYKLYLEKHSHRKIDHPLHIEDE